MDGCGLMYVKPCCCEKVANPQLFGNLCCYHCTNMGMFDFLIPVHCFHVDHIGDSSSGIKRSFHHGVGKLQIWDSTERRVMGMNMHHRLATVKFGK